MSDDRSIEELLNHLNKTNDNFSNQVIKLKRRFSKDNSNRAKIEKFIQSYSSLERGVPLNQLDLYEKGAEEFVKILKEHPVYHGEKGSIVGLPLFGNFSQMDRVETKILTNAANLFASGLIALGSLGQLDEPSLLALIQISFSADALSRTFGLILSGKSIPKDFDPEIPILPIDLEKELQRFCGFGLLSTARDFAIALGAEINSANELAKHPFQFRAYATGIETIEPDHGCEGQTVRISGSGFGKLSKNLKLYFPKFGGGCKAIDDPDIIKQGQNVIDVNIPKDVGSGYVGFVEKIGNWEPPQTSLGSAADSLAGTMEMCLGPAGFGAAAQIRKMGMYLSPPPMIPCPQSLPNKENYFGGGPPYINYFSVNDKNRVVSIMKGDCLTVKWSVENASKVEIAPIGAQQNELKNFPSVQHTGTESFTPNGNYPWAAEYEIRAQNECGVTSQRVLIMLQFPDEKAPSPTDFMWGVATAATQVEGNVINNDWDVFSKSPKITKRVQDNAKIATGEVFQIRPPGQALNHLYLDVLKQDLRRAKAIGMNTYRFSIEWSRIQPYAPPWAVKSIAARKSGNNSEAHQWYEAPLGLDDNNFVRNEIDHYRQMVNLIIEEGFIPVLTLNHLSLPKWVLTPPEDNVTLPVNWPFTTIPIVPYTFPSETDSGFNSSLRGWEDYRIVKAFNAFVQRIVQEFSDVKFWITLNEPIGSIIGAGYIAGVWSPGFIMESVKAINVMQNLIKAHVKAYDTIKAAKPEAQIGIAHAMMYFKTSKLNNTTGENKEATKQLNYTFNEYFLNALVNGDIDLSYQWKLEKRNNIRVDNIDSNDWNPKLDFIGVNYYRSAYVYKDDGLALLTGRVWGGRYDNNMNTQNTDAHSLLNDMGWEICPEGLHEILVLLHDNYPTLPVLITENGIPESKDRNRSAFTISHINELANIKSTVNILGYIHWSIADNWEWHYGYSPVARFGIFTIPGLDGSNGRLRREITETAVAFHYLISENGDVQPTTEKFGTITRNGKTVRPPSLTAGSIWEGVLDPGYNHERITIYWSPLKNKKLVGMIYYHQSNLWHSLTNILWNSTTKVIQFSHRLGSKPGSLTRLFEAKLLNNTFDGTMIHEDIDRILIQDWSATKYNVHGVWNESATVNPKRKKPVPRRSANTGPPKWIGLESLMFKKFEDKLQAKCMLKSNVSQTYWMDFESVTINSSGKFELILVSAYPDILRISGQIIGNNIAANVTSLSGLNFSWTGVKGDDSMPF